MNQFKCCKCGSNKLSYQWHNHSQTDVDIGENNIHYGMPINNDDTCLSIQNRYLCGTCGYPLHHVGFEIKTERQLLDFLNTDPIMLINEQIEYIEHIESDILAQKKHKISNN